MKEGASVVLASNRGPISFTEPNSGGFGIKRGAGGLSGALDPVARRLGADAVWIAAATSDVDRRALHAGAADELGDLLGYPHFLIDIEPDRYADYYDVVSNRMLWFANHCLWDELQVKSFGKHEIAAFESAYEPVNRRFAQAISEVAAPDALVLLQDYHLSTAPLHVRHMRPDQTIFHFTHSSFCGPSGLERCPRPIPRRIIEGMLGADLLGFHVPSWVRGFLACAERIGAEVDPEEGIVRYDGRRTWVRSYPIPVDAGDLSKRAEGEPARAWAERFRSRTKGPLIVRADRTEPSKNIVRGFKAFGLLLDRHPDLVDNAHFVACIYPSRHSMAEYRHYTEEIRSSVEEVNDRHPGSIDLYLEDDFDRTIGALLVYDVLLVNPLMDGMNLVSKEGPIVNERDGVLVLSSGAGSYEELGPSSVGIEDAADLEQTVAALERAIDMDDGERSERQGRLRSLVSERRPSDWIQSQLADLEAIQGGGPPITPAHP